MVNLLLLKKELAKIETNELRDVGNYYSYTGFRECFETNPVIAKARATAKIFTMHEKHIYENDLVAGSVSGLYSRRYTDAELTLAGKIVNSYGKNTFFTNADHDAVDFETVLSLGVGGLIKKIDYLLKKQRDEKKRTFLNAALIAMTAFSEMISQYGEAAFEKAQETGKKNLFEIARICRKISREKPESFHEALQLVWMIHISFLYEGRYAMALGRLDQYLFPFYKKDSLSKEKAAELLACTLYKIHERFIFTGGDDVVNIAIGGVTRDGSDGVNELTYLILDAVRECRVPGPNLSARVSKKNPDIYLHRCLEVIGTGIGYPALMNDEINIAALARYGYSIEDCRDYCMVGCIENFIPGKQPPWSDGRYNSPKYIEMALNNGKCMLTGVQTGPETGGEDEFDTMEDFLRALKTQMAHGAAEYVRLFNNEAIRYNNELYVQPFLSCFHNECIERGLDIRDGGTIYPSVHGAGCIGIATVADSLAVIEKFVFEEKLLTLRELRNILISDFEGHEEIRQRFINAPKYGNNDDFVDKYAKWFVDTHYEIFSKYKTFDGGGIYVAIASNVDNIPAGKEIAATPDGRKRGEPLSDAASPAHGADKNGITASLLSCSKPDFTKSACGTVLNIKFSGEVFQPKNIDKLKALVRVYFERGGQELQINCVSKSILEEASKNPQNHKDLVVRVSGFSAFYVCLDSAVQKDILERTEHG